MLIESRDVKAVRRYPVGAEVLNAGKISFRVWAPDKQKMTLIVQKKAVNDYDIISRGELDNEGNGYFSGTFNFNNNILYSFQLDNNPKLFPDPASRFQPFGPHGPSQVVDPNKFKWTDDEWKGYELKKQIVYELHVGTFTKAGRWESARKELKELSDLGITCIEIMPVAEFAGNFGWGYDGVDLFAPTRLYGKPDDFRNFVNTAHSLGIGVILDVVYNHVGPDGNYLKEFSSDYFTTEYKTDWGDAINFDGNNSEPVRQFFIANAEYWIEEYHIDGLRLDATQDIHDSSSNHILAEITSKIKNKSKKKNILVIAENEPQEVKLIKEQCEGGFGMDAVWNDDFHHSAVVCLTGNNEAYYTDYKGKPQEFISSIKYGYLFQGQRYKWQKKRRGTAAHKINPEKFVFYIQNHDQIANSARGNRIHTLSIPGKYRAIVTLNLLAPGIPMIFQGQEFNASAPFLYFADHNEELARLTKKGRISFLSQFRRLLTPEMQQCLPNPMDRNSFEICKLNLHEREKNLEIYTMYKDLIKVRKKLIEMDFQGIGRADGAILTEDCFLIRYFLDDYEKLLIINLEKDINLNPAPEPLLAPPEGMNWEIEFSTEDPKYGGCGTPPLDTDDGWQILSYSAVLLKSEWNPKFITSIGTIET